MTVFWICLGVIVAALAVAAALLLRGRGQHRGGDRSSPPSQMRRLLDDHSQGKPLRGPDPREEGEET